MKHRTEMMNLWRRSRAWVYLFALIALHVWLVQETFWTESTGHWKSIHGYWMGMAREIGLDWFSPRWWPYGGGGAPIEYVYNPLIPALTAGLSKVLAVSIPQSFHVLSGLVAVAGPVLLYIASWRIFRAPGDSFAAALAYSLVSAAQWVAPEESRIGDLFASRRLYLLLEWDDLPHLTSLALAPLAVLFLMRMLEGKGRRFAWPAGLTMAAMMLANMFGLVLSGIVALTAGAMFGWRGILRAAVLVGAAWVVVSRWIPVSLLVAVRRNAVWDGEVDTPARSAMAVLIVAGIAVAVAFAARRIDWRMRWLLVFGTVLILIPVLAQYTGLHFLPQPGRYKLELDLAVAWIGVFALRPLMDRLGRWRFAIAGLAVVAAVPHIQSQRTFARDLTRPAEVQQSIEARVVRWIEANLPEQRVHLPGSIAMWAPAFGNVSQVAGVSYSTALNFIEPIAAFTVHSGQNAGERDAEIAELWLRAMGAQAVVVPGPASPEAWKPVFNTQKFEGRLPLLWREDDTSIYAVPQRSKSLAHGIRSGDLVQRVPAHGLQVDEVVTYVRALESARDANLSWTDTNHARVTGQFEPADVLATQINYAPGWTALVHGARVPTRSDGLGLLVVDPGCVGPCEVFLSYDGTWETFGGLAAGVTLLLTCLVVTFRPRHPISRGGSDRPPI